jgi:signal transduction histidine kinase
MFVPTAESATMVSVSASDQQFLRLQRQLAAAQRISQALFQHKSLNDLAETALNVALEICEADAGSILLADPESQQLVFQYTTGHRIAPGTTLPIGQSIAGSVFQSRKPEVIPDVAKDPRHCVGIGALDGFRTRDLVAVPLQRWDGDPVGVLEILNKRNGTMDEDDLLVLTIIAAFTAIAIEQARLFQEAKLGEIVGLLGDIGHDLKNMLTPIVMGAGLMDTELEEFFRALPAVDPKKTQETHELCTTVLGMVKTSSRRIQDRVKQLADCVKGEISTPCFRPCKISAVIDSVVGALKILADEKGIALQCEGLADLSDLDADETRLYNAFYNLINNAIPEVPRGGSITVRGKAEPDTRSILISVADTGRGMPPDIRDSLFTSRTISRKPGGTGLGTRIVKDVVDAHGGSITVESKENVGTTFYLRLPLRMTAGHEDGGLRTAPV